MNNHVRPPSSQHNHLDKLLFSVIVKSITMDHPFNNNKKTQEHIGPIIGDEITYQSSNEGTTINKPTPAPMCTLHPSKHIESQHEL